MNTVADVKWIKITTDIFDDEKILLIESLPDSYAIITVWFKLLCLAGKQNNSGVFMMGRIPYTDKMLATIFRMKEATVTMALQTFEQFGMVEIVDGVITIPNWGKHQNLEQLEERRNYQREYQKAYRKKQKLLAAAEENTDKHLRKHLRKQNVNSPEEDIDKEIDKEIDTDEEEKSVRETTHTLFKRLLPDYILSDTLQAKMGEWITYKVERKESYKEQGMKSLLRQVENNQIKYGEQAVCNLIDECMANNWKGIIFDKLTERGKAKPRYGNFDANDEFNKALKRSYSEPEMHKSENSKTVADDKAVRERAEKLKKMLGERG